jgi:hypothetical protein
MEKWKWEKRFNVKEMEEGRKEGRKVEVNIGRMDKWKELGLGVGEK